MAATDAAHHLLPPPVTTDAVCLSYNEVAAVVWFHNQVGLLVAELLLLLLRLVLVSVAAVSAAALPCYVSCSTHEQ
jgi:hypothetical protein